MSSRLDVKLSSNQTVGVAVLLSVILWAVLSWLVYTQWVHGIDYTDFMTRWVGARFAIFEGGNPYSPEAVEAIQVTIYGKTLPPDIDQHGFAAPAHVIPLLLPFWLVRDIEVASSLWTGFSIVLFVWALVFLQRVWGSNDFMPMLIVVPIAILWVYPLQTFYVGQFIVFCAACLVIAYWAYINQHEFLAGFLLAAATIKPELTVVPITVLLLFAIRAKRWRVPIFAGLTGLALLAISVLRVGWWVPSWLAQVSDYNDYARVAWPPGILWELSPWLLGALVIGLGILLMRPHWTQHLLFAASVALGMLLLPQTLNYGLTMLLIPLSYAWHAGRRWLVAAVWPLGWFMFLGSAIVGGTPVQWWQAQMVVIPLIALLLLLLAKRVEPELVI